MTWADAIRLVEDELTENRWGSMPQAALRSVLAQMRVKQAIDTVDTSQVLEPVRVGRVVDWGEQ